MATVTAQAEGAERPFTMTGATRGITPTPDFEGGC